MNFRDIFIISRGTKVILAITFSVSLAAVIFAFFYYRTLNRSEDPRISKARIFLQKYDESTAIAGNSVSLSYLDSAYSVFKSLPDYVSSFETGLIYNNKCSALLLSALYDSLMDREIRNHLLSLSMKYCDSSIIIYTRWISIWGSLEEDEIRRRSLEYMRRNDPAFAGYKFEKILDRRVENIKMAQIETPRRMSVSYSNKGAIYRHMMIPDSSVFYYTKALSLWNDNRVAKSNLNVLMGGKPLKPTLIESLFPPDRNKK